MTSLRVIKFIIGYLLFQRFILGTEEKPLPNNILADTDDGLLRIHFLLKNYSKLPKDNPLPYYIHLVLPNCTIPKNVGYTLGRTDEFQNLNRQHTIPGFMKNCDFWAWAHDLINLLILVYTIFLICCQIVAQEYLIRITRIRIKESKGYKRWIIINALLNGLINGLLIILILVHFKSSAYCM